jgi:hypothetical protein
MNTVALIARLQENIDALRTQYANIYPDISHVNELVKASSNLGDSNPNIHLKLRLNQLIKIYEQDLKLLQALNYINANLLLGAITQIQDDEKDLTKICHFILYHESVHQNFQKLHDIYWISKIYTHESCRNAFIPFALCLLGLTMILSSLAALSAPTAAIFLATFFPLVCIGSIILFCGMNLINFHSEHMQTIQVLHTYLKHTNVRSDINHEFLGINADVKNDYTEKFFTSQQVEPVGIEMVTLQSKV